MTLHPDLPPGLTGRVEVVVGADDTAVAAGSGDVPVLSTPRLIALCERATMLALGALLPDGWTSVAMRVQFDHLAPVGVGGALVAEAVLDRVVGRRLVFTVTASDASGLIGAGKVTRIAVERERFLSRAH